MNYIYHLWCKVRAAANLVAVRARPGAQQNRKIKILIEEILRGSTLKPPGFAPGFIVNKAFILKY